MQFHAQSPLVSVFKNQTQPENPWRLPLIVCRVSARIENEKFDFKYYLKLIMGMILIQCYNQHPTNL